MALPELNIQVDGFVTLYHKAEPSWMIHRILDYDRYTCTLQDIDPNEAAEPAPGMPELLPAEVRPSKGGKPKKKKPAAKKRKFRYVGEEAADDPDEGPQEIHLRPGQYPWGQVHLIEPVLSMPKGKKYIQVLALWPIDPARNEFTTCYYTARLHDIIPSKFDGVPPTAVVSYDSDNHTEDHLVSLRVDMFGWSLPTIVEPGRPATSSTRLAAIWAAFDKRAEAEREARQQQRQQQLQAAAAAEESKMVDDGEDEDRGAGGDEDEDRSGSEPEDGMQARPKSGKRLKLGKKGSNSSGGGRKRKRLRLVVGAGDSDDDDVPAVDSADEFSDGDGPTPVDNSNLRLTLPTRTAPTRGAPAGQRASPQLGRPGRGAATPQFSAEALRQPVQLPTFARRPDMPSLAPLLANLRSPRPPPPPSLQQNQQQPQQQQPQSPPSHSRSSFVPPASSPQLFRSALGREHGWENLMPLPERSLTVAPYVVRMFY